MTQKFIKIEFLLPRFFNTNDGERKNIPNENFNMVNDELIENMGGFSIATEPIIGIWVDNGGKIDDKHTVYWILCENSKKNIQFFRKLKKKIEKLFEQKEIMMFYAQIEKN